MKTLLSKVGVYTWHTVVCIVVVAVSLGLFWAISYALGVHNRQQAEQLVEQLAGLGQGPTALRTLEKLTQDLSGTRRCSGGLCTYDFEQGAFTYSPWLRVLRRTEWDYLGLRPWRVVAHVETKNGGLTDVELRAGVGRGRGWLWNEGPLSGNMWAQWMVTVKVNADRFDQLAPLLDESYGRQITPRRNNHGIIVLKPSFDTPGGGEALQVYLSPTASAETKKAAFGIDLRCATALSACSGLPEFAPFAWNVYMRSPDKRQIAEADSSYPE